MKVFAREMLKNNVNDVNFLIVQHGHDRIGTSEASDDARTNAYQIPIEPGKRYLLNLIAIVHLLVNDP